MKKILGLLVSSMLVIGMVGCGADEVAEDAYEEAKDKVEEQTEPVEKPKDETKPSNPGGVQGNAKSEAYAKLSVNANAKKLADAGYVKGDLTRINQNGTIRYVVNNWSKYSSAGLTDLYNNVTVDGTVYNHVFDGSTLIKIYPESSII